MRYFQYLEPEFGGIEGEFLGCRVITLSEEEILETYYPYWRAAVERVNPTHFENKSEDELKEDALQDWAIINWADEVKEEDI